RDNAKINVCVTIVTPSRNSQQFRIKFFCKCGNYHRAKSSDALRFSSCSRKVFAGISEDQSWPRNQTPPFTSWSAACPARPEPSRNVDRHCSVYALDDRISLSLGFAGLIRCCVIDQLIADTPSVWSARAASG